MSTVHAVYVAHARRQPLVAVAEARAVPGKGLEGDRYFLGRGSMSRWPGPGRAVSFIEQEVIEALAREHGLDLDGGRSRRNVVTRGVALLDLKGRTFRAGTAVFRGVRPCDPCLYLERLAGEGVYAALKGRGGLRADVVAEGVVRPGDVVEVV